MEGYQEYIGIVYGFPLNFLSNTAQKWNGDSQL